MIKTASHCCETGPNTVVSIVSIPAATQSLEAPVASLAVSADRGPTANGVRVADTTLWVLSLRIVRL